MNGVDISASDVKELRQMTHVGMMECKNALLEAGGDREKAVKILKEKGLSISAKRSSRQTNEGIVFIGRDDVKVWMVKVCCETDFVSKGSHFTSFSKEVGDRLLREGEPVIETEDFKLTLSETVAKTGEKIEVVDPVCIEIGNDLVESYLHSNKKIGVSIILSSNHAASLLKDEVKELGRDLCLQIAAMDPVAVSMKDVLESVKEDQKKIFLKQMEGDSKPAEIKKKIITGKLNKYFSEKCLLEMDYVKGSGSVKQHIDSVASSAGSLIEVKAFHRLQIGN